jgi:uncharacterized surface protein with fasciclin (FAS1) repeats
VLCATLARAAEVAKSGEKKIVETAIAANDFKTLITALKAADLIKTLEGDGPFTVFAPTDEAFKKLGKEKLAELLKPENKDKLADILKYHVVAGKVMAKEVGKMNEAKTVEGGSLTIKMQGGKVMIDKAHVAKSDIECTNGVIHVIDTVLIPKTTT